MVIKKQKVHSGFVSPNIGNTPVMCSTVKRRLVVSFSGGRTSAYMLWWLLNKWVDRHNWEIIVVFANTGKEVEGTLFFVDECAKEWGINIIWLEAKHKDEAGNTFSNKGWKVSYKIVDYETASRNGEPFEEMISVLGIPSTEAPFCSPQLKREPIKAYLKDIGWDDYYIAIGIRYDEQQRLNDNWMTNNIYYPLCFSEPTTKRNVKQFWDNQTFDLDIHVDDGNCDGCWKKSFPTLTRIMNRKPQTFDWWQNMTEKYSFENPRNKGMMQNFYRGNKSVLDIKQMAELTQAELKQLTMFEVLDGCAESCEVW